MNNLAVVAAVSLVAIVLIWLGYPVAIWAISRVVSRPPRPDHARSAATTVSVVVATRDSAEVIVARVRNLLETKHPPEKIEVIVALDAAGAPADEACITAIDPRVRVVRGDLPGGKASALNAGVRHATGELLVLTDAAQRFDAQTIPELAANLADERFGAMSGALSLEGHRSPVHWYWSIEKWLRSNEALIHSSVGVTGAVYATRRALWPVIPAETLLDDLYVPMQLVLQGHRIGFTYAARAYDARVFDETAEAQRKTRTLTGVLQLQLLLPGLFSVRRNPVLLQLFLHKFARLATPFLSTVFAVSVIVMVLWYLGQSHVSLAVLGWWLLGVALLLLTLRKRVMSTLRWTVAMQVATLRAIMNSARRQWRVWNR